MPGMHKVVHNIQGFAHPAGQINGHFLPTQFVYRFTFTMGSKNSPQFFDTH